LNAARAILAATNPAAAAAASCLNENNPACGINTSFSNYNGSNPTTATGACDHHDYCYSTCWAASGDFDFNSHKSVCDFDLHAELLRVCAVAEILGQDPQPVIDACNFFADAYYFGVANIPIVSSSIYGGDQTQACMCCSSSSPQPNISRNNASFATPACISNPPSGPPPDNSGNWTWDPTANGGQGAWVWTGPIPPPPDNSGNWTWDPSRGAWVWNGSGNPPSNGGNPPPTGCWHWDAASGSWVSDPCGGGGQPVSPNPIQIITSGDPNDKVGNKGAGSPQYVRSGQATNYSIYFDNIPTATAPAQKVMVTDQLTSSVVDMSTVSLGKISFVNNLITPPSTPLATIGTYSTNVDLRPAQNLIVNIVVALNQNTGILTWTYTSLDPSTMQPTTDPLAGFLPPGTEGSVSFSVTPKPAATGTQVTNQATVVFDVNPPINTPIWANTIDSTRPVSKVSALPTPELSPSFSVQWSGTDVGAGVQDYTIYVSDNAGSFTAWLTNTTATQGNYIGSAGHSYGFYSIARDLVGNIETSKTMAEATTNVTTAVIIPSTQVATTASGLAYSRVTQTFNGTVTVKNIGTTMIAGPLEVVFTALPSGVTLANATGSIGGLTYLTLSSASLVPGQSATVNVQFQNPGNVQINFTPVIYSGGF
jgi:hypothetical protein